MILHDDWIDINDQITLELASQAGVLASRMFPGPCLMLAFLSITVHQVFSTGLEPEQLRCAVAKDGASEAGKSVVSRVAGGRNATYAPYQVIYLWTLKSNLSRTELQKRANRANLLVLIFPGRC